jgi:hypothetical protein
MDYNAQRNSLKPFCGLVGLLLVLLAAAKLAGLHFGLGASASELALVGIGLLHV